MDTPVDLAALLRRLRLATVGRLVADGVPQSFSGQLISSTRSLQHVHLRSRPVLGQAQA